MLAALLPSKSLANWIDTWLLDDGVNLHVSGTTVLTANDQGPYCDPYFGSGYICYGTNYPAVRVDTKLLAPGAWPVQNSQSIDASYAEASFSFYPPAAGGQWWGWWWGDSDHYVQAQMYQQFCIEPGFACHCPSGFPFFCGSMQHWQFLGQTSSFVIVDPPPPDVDVIVIEISRHTSASLTASEVDNGIFPAASILLQTDHGQGDVACPIEFQRGGSISVFAAGNGVIDSQASLNEVMAAPGRAKVVSEISFCSGPPPPGQGQILYGCSGFLGMAVIRTGSLAACRADVPHQ